MMNSATVCRYVAAAVLDVFISLLSVSESADIQICDWYSVVFDRYWRDSYRTFTNQSRV